MDEIEEVVAEIVRGCKENKVECSELLAAFVARTMLEGDAQTFALEKEVRTGAPTPGESLVGEEAV